MYVQVECRIRKDVYPILYAYSVDPVCLSQTFRKLSDLTYFSNVSACLLKKYLAIRACTYLAHTASLERNDKTECVVCVVDL
jgi:hypothetical protein